MSRHIITHSDMDLLAKQTKKLICRAFIWTKETVCVTVAFGVERKQSLPCVDVLWHVGESQKGITGLRLSGRKQKDRKGHRGVIIHFKYSKGQLTIK